MQLIETYKPQNLFWPEHHCFETVKMSGILGVVTQWACSPSDLIVPGILVLGHSAGPLYFEDQLEINSAPAN